MIVFGDPARNSTFASEIHSFKSRLPSTRPCLDDLRMLLISAGQIEQAIYDTPFIPDQARRSSMRLTDSLAEAFSTLFLGNESFDWAATHSQCEQALKWLRDADGRGTFKTPEGFAFYTLFPEQYILSAQKWLTSHSRSESVIMVAGVLSIGSTLGAVVKSTLKLHGVPAHRINVRPTGHPYERRCEFPQIEAKEAIIVDEGPGASGSSMASVAMELRRQGLHLDQITFFPGNNHDPGIFASAEVRKIWAQTTKQFTDVNEVRWSGKSLIEMLHNQSAELLKSDEPLQFRDLTGGNWRNLVFVKKQDWPEAYRQFERTKYAFFRTNHSSSDHQGLHWKFKGFHFSSCEQPYRHSSHVPVARNCAGFEGTYWESGAMIETAKNMIPFLANYIKGTTGEPLDTFELTNSTRRLWKMTEHNLLKISPNYNLSYLPSPDEVVQSLESCPSYSDGRMASYEWRIQQEKIIKFDYDGHNCDHTVVGVQPIYWDIAGTIVEWNLDQDSKKIFLELLSPSLDIRDELLSFYSTAYLAFKIGKAHFCHSIEEDSGEKYRLRKSIQNSLHQLSNLHEEDFQKVLLT